MSETQAIVIDSDDENSDSGDDIEILNDEFQNLDFGKNNLFSVFKVS